MNNLEIPTASPFDAIKQVRNDGTEYWSARDLQGLLGYTEWRKFEGAIERAQTAANNQNLETNHHFVRAAKVIKGGRWGSQTIEDHELTRYAAYLVAMNGDPRKAEIAAAQSYFAIRTREAEITTPKALPAGPELIALALIEANKMLEEKDRVIEAQEKEIEQKNEELSVVKPQAEKYTAFLGAEGSVSIQQAAQLLTRSGIQTGQKRLFAYLDEIKWTSNPKNRSRRAMQTAVNTGYLELKAMTYKHPRTGEVIVAEPQIRITPKGLHKLRDLLLPPIEIKELF